ncbi:MAG TPA: hypothetical protein VGO76_08540 [Luteibacter sp.]|jgi:hypothetical protein|nr:hypothetical protein [Luteibacter sp.]
MKAYVITTGAIFALIVIAHVWRIAVEGPALAGSPIFILFTLAAAGLALWAWWVLRRLPRA